MKTTAPRYIDASKEATLKLAKAFRVTEKFVYLCLTYRKNNETARKIRFVAVRDYEAKPMLHVPECETLHDTTEDGRQIMRQVFDNGATLRADKRTGEAWITNRRGEVVEHRNRIGKLSELAELQTLAENL